MKKSNKFLLAGFLTLLVFITAIHITLYAKYKSGDSTLYNADEDLLQGTVQSFPNILFVSVQNVPYATVQFSDVAQVGKEEKGDIRYTRKGDTLLISRNDSNARQGFESPVAFRLPANATLSVLNSSLTFTAAGKITGYSPVINLKNSSAVFSGEATPFRFNQLRIVATDSSAVLLQGNITTNRLDVQLSNSAINGQEGTISGQFSIVTDSLSRIALQASQLLKADIKTSTPQ